MLLKKYSPFTATNQFNSSILYRYDVVGWLELHQKAQEHFHPQHEVCNDLQTLKPFVYETPTKVMCEIAKWATPILARGPGVGLESFPLSLINKKIEIGEIYMRVILQVEGAYSRNWAKTAYEVKYLSTIGLYQNTLIFFNLGRG